jgi:hypothetical protein
MITSSQIITNEKEIYPTRYLTIPITSTFIYAASELENYERDERRMSIDLAADLILDASGYLHENNGRRYQFISVYSKIFPEVNTKEIRRIKKLAPLFAKKTLELGRLLANPERLNAEERKDLAHKLINISNSIMSKGFSQKH